MNILFVGNENICRSPMAEALLRKKFEKEGIKSIVDSAGFESHMINEPPDKRAVNIAKSYGYEVTGKMRIFKKEDFDKFDKIYVMDTKNYHDVLELAKTQNHKDKIDYILNLINDSSGNNILANPILQGEENCHQVFIKLDKATDALVEKIKAGKF